MSSVALVQFGNKPYTPEAFEFQRRITATNGELPKELQHPLMLCNDNILYNTDRIDQQSALAGIVSYGLWCFLPSLHCNSKMDNSLSGSSGFHCCSDKEGSSKAYCICWMLTVIAMTIWKDLQGSAATSLALPECIKTLLTPAPQLATERYRWSSLEPWESSLKGQASYFQALTTLTTLVCLVTLNWHPSLTIEAILWWNYATGRQIAKKDGWHMYKYILYSGLFFNAQVSVLRSLILWSSIPACSIQSPPTPQWSESDSIFDQKCNAMTLEVGTSF